LSLSEAFGSRATWFPKIYCSTLGVGRAVRRGGRVLQRYIAIPEDADGDQAQGPLGAHLPACLFLMSIVVIVILITMVVPKFVDFYGDLGADLPLITRVLIRPGRAWSRITSCS